MADFDWGGLLGGALSAGASLYSSKQQQKAAEDAAAKQTEAYQSAINQTASLNQPYTQAGNFAINKLMNVANGADSLSSDPGTLYATSQAQKAIERAASARGNVGSSRTMSELMRSANDYAQTGYNNAWNRLSGLAGVGQAATSQNINAMVPYTAGIGNVQAASGIAGNNARQSGYQGAANALSGYLSNGGASQLASGAGNIYKSLFGNSDAPTQPSNSFSWKTGQY